MEISSVVLKHNFDRDMLAQIDSLRTVRLNMAESMLKNLATTMTELESRGLAEDVDADELRVELMTKIKTLRERLQRPDVIFADEIDLYTDLLDKTELDDEGLEEDIDHLED